MGRLTEDGVIDGWVTALYDVSGVVRSVPAVDAECPSETRWPWSHTPATLARAILAHLVGLDVPEPTWTAFAGEVTCGLSGQWSIPVEEVLEWLERRR